MELTIGLSHKSELTVTDDKTAQAMGSGDMPVLATPALVALMENAAMLAVAGALAEGDTTVGAQIAVEHLRPSPQGMEVTATATLTAVDGRRLTFDIEAHDSTGAPIGHATHVRYIVARERFLLRTSSAKPNTCSTTPR